MRVKFSKGICLVLSLSVLFLLAACNASQSKAEPAEWLPADDLDKAVFSVSVDFKNGQTVSARAGIASQDEQQRNVTWDQSAPQQVAYGERKTAPWQPLLSMPFTVETAVPYIQTVRGWVEENLPGQPEFHVGFQADHADDLQKTAQEWLRSVRESRRTALIYSMETTKVVLWESETLPDGLLGYGTLSGITAQGEQIYSPIWMIA